MWLRTVFGVSLSFAASSATVRYSSPTRRAPTRARLPLAALSARSAERLEAGIWDTVTRVLRDPEALRRSAQAKQLRFDAVRVDARTEITSLTEQRATLQRQRSRLLDLYVSDGIDKPTFTRRDAPLKAQEDAVAARLAQAEGRLAQETTELHNHDALRAFCEAVRRGVNRLDDAGRQALLYRVVERAVVHDVRTDVHLKLDVTAPTTARTPGKSAAGGHLSRPGNRAESQDTQPSFYPMRYVVRVSVD
jgi:hypothetical protein